MSGQGQEILPITGLKKKRERERFINVFRFIFNYFLKVNFLKKLTSLITP